MTITPIPLRMCNAYLVQGDGSILIDTGRHQDASAIRTALEKHGVGPGDLTLILQTHGHWDHCGSTRELKGWTAAPVAIHRNDADNLRRGDNGCLKPIGLSGRLLLPFLDRRYPGVEPDIMLEGETSLEGFGVSARVVPTPGHTSGSISVVNEAGDAIVGDLVMGGYLGGHVLTGCPTYHYFAENLAELRASLRGLVERGVRRIFSGHGGPLDAKRAAQRLG